MSHPTCYCSVSLGRCDRCDLLVDLEGFHLVAAARRERALVLDIESCDRCAGCPGCGVIAQGHGRVVVEVIDAPWAGVPVRIRWFKRRWICRETTCQTVTFLEHDERVCAPRARLGTRAIRWVIRQLRFEGATIAGLARQLATTWNTVWSHIKPCLQAASDDPARFAGVRVLGVDEHVWHHQDRRRRGPRELTGIVDLTRGKDHPTARLLDLMPGRSGTVYKNWLAERSEQFRSGIQIATLDPFQGQQERHRLANSKTQSACWTPFTSSSSLATPQVRCVAASSKKHWDTADAQAIPSTWSAISCAPVVIGSRSVNKNDSAQPSRQMKHTSVSKSPTTAPSKYARSSTKPHPPKADAWPHTSSSAYQRVPSPKSLAWAGPYARGRMPSWPTSTPTEPATHPTEAIYGIIELGRRTARGYRNPTNYKLRMLLIAGGLDASTHTQL